MPSFSCSSFFVLALFVLPITVSSQSTESYIVHMDLSFKPTPFSDHLSWYLATLSSLSQRANGETKLIHSYTEAIQGFSAILTPSELQALASTPGFVSTTRNRPLKLLTTHSPQFLGLSPQYGAWPASGYGEDVIIGVLDSGVWPESESFRDEGMTPVPSRWKGTCISDTHFNSSSCNSKLIGARFYNKGYIAEHPHKKISINSVRDTNGHGTHTSSTAAGNYINGASYFGYAPGTAKGMAPRARLAIYKVGWYNEVSPSDLLAGLDQAIRDGVDILSMSLGYNVARDTPLDDDPISVATFAAMRNGIFVAVAAGNEGPGYLTLANGAPWATVVGAGTMDRKLGGILTLGNGMKIPFISLYLENFSRDTQFPLIFNDTSQELKGKIVVLVGKDTASMELPLEEAKAANASAVLMITNESKYSLGSFFPAGLVGDQDGKILIDYIKQTRFPTGALWFKRTFLGTKPAPLVDSYSSRGPFPSCPTVLKPDIIAPGTLILASWPTNTSASPDPFHPLFGNFYVDEGTSMATPHVAGAAALVKSVHPDWSPAAVRSALITTASAYDNNDGRIKDVHGGVDASPLAIGAGHVRPNSAISPGLVYDAGEDDYIGLLCAMNYTARQIRTITGSIFKCANWSRTELNYPSFISYFNGNGSNVVREFRRIMTNVGEEQSSYNVYISAMAGFNLKVEPERLTFKRKYEKRSYKLTMEGPKLMKQDVVQGSLSWVEGGGKYMVRSTIVAIKDSLLRD